MAIKFLHLSLLATVFGSIKAYVDKAVKKVKDDIIDGAPEAYDTLKEIGTYIAEHESVKDGILTTIGSKANSADVYSKTVADSTFAKKTDLGALATADDVYTKDQANERFLISSDYEQATAEEVEEIAEAIFN